MHTEENIIALSCQIFEVITKSNIKINGLSNINEMLSVHYLIYRIDNLTNNKHYIGQHQTNNPLDSYMGSGKYLLRAIYKEGIENFVKTILFDFDNANDMNQKEIELVSLSSCYPNDPLSYNLKEGGYGGSLSGELNPLYGKPFSDEHKQHISDALKNRKLSDEHKQHLSEAAKGNEYSWDKLSEVDKYKAKCKTSESLKKVKHTKEWNKKISLTLKNKTNEQRKVTYEKFINTLNNHTEEEKRQIHINRSK